MKCRRKLLTWCGLAVVMVGLSAVRLPAQEPLDPEVDGKRLSKWFEQLESEECNSNNVPVSFQAEGVLQRLKPDAIPFLLARLRYDPVSDPALIGLDKDRAEERRAQAASLLRIMGQPALSAVPALLEAWKNDPSKTVKINCVLAMAWILEVEIPSYHFRYNKKDVGIPNEAYQAIETEVIASVFTLL